MIDVTDTESPDGVAPFTEGGFGLRTYSAAATFTNVMISKLDGTVVYDEADMTDDITFARALWLFLRKTGLAKDATATASGENSSDPATNLNNSAIPRWTNYGVNNFNTTADQRNTWVQYEWQKSVTLDGMRLTWMDDNGGVQTPQGFCIEYWDGEGWNIIENVENGDQLPANKEVYYGFEPVTSNKFRVVPYNSKTNRTTAQPGIYEWAVEGEYADNT